MIDVMHGTGSSCKTECKNRINTKYAFSFLHFAFMGFSAASCSCMFVQVLWTFLSEHFLVIIHWISSIQSLTIAMSHGIILFLLNPLPNNLIFFHLTLTSEEDEQSFSIHDFIHFHIIIHLACTKLQRVNLVAPFIQAVQYLQWTLFTPLLSFYIFTLAS